MLGPILFAKYINDLPDALENMIKLFADDANVFASVNNEDDKNSLQGDIDKLMKLVRYMVTEVQ